ncbi:hypothetical protein Drose_05985 [Dactylosporangium roseum]|uniref:Uncharacterized protein n=1 Tax=Dactylosporangium roseum TaxID=47989 RepID=A0ABY5Z6Z3_9ACTN|nr:hypothetical protein [Dactylosporangium roseum]UWZ37821.1 hypothetical protein Drose_05985 [Dactylosporangium roseum]
MSTDRPTAQSVDSYRLQVHTASMFAAVFAAVAVFVDRLGYTAEGVAGVVFGAVAFGVAVGSAALYDRAVARQSVGGVA